MLPVTEPLGVVTATFFAPGVALAGVTIVICVAEFTTKLVTAIPLIVTEVAPKKLVPVIMEVVPPETSPTAAEATVVIVGAPEFHCAYKIVFAEMEKVPPAAYWVPVPLAAVFQPAKVFPVLTNEPTGLVVTVDR